MEIFTILFGIWIVQAIIVYCICKYFTRLPSSSTFSMSKDDASFLFTAGLVPIVGLLFMLLGFIASIIEQSNLFK